MVFTSPVFGVFFAVVLAGLALLPKRDWRQVWLLIASYYFYAYWKPGYAILLAAPTVWAYVCAIRIEDAGSAPARKRWLTANVVFNVALLGYFKYTNFFADNIAALFGRKFRDLDILLPIGISFYTFKILSYTIDVYRKEIPASRSLWRFAMFVSYFPELIAGPIVRASIFLPQMRRELRLYGPRLLVGMQAVLLGVTKKRLIADQMADFVDPVFRAPANFSSATVLCAVIAYSLQIYCDFSGYSDISIGISKIIGFDLPENFNMPYLATSVVEFWRRWHITLSNWLRDYVFFSLGGLRSSSWKRYRNVIVTMLIGGLWHGASWNFVFWGLLHGVALAVNQGIEAWRRSRRRPAPRGVTTTVVNWVLTYAFICLTWIFFRSPNFGTSMEILRKVFFLDPVGVHFSYWPFYMAVPTVIAGHLIGIYVSKGFAGHATRRKTGAPAWLAPLYRQGEAFAVRPGRYSGAFLLVPFPTFTGAAALTLWVLIVYLFSATNANPFIYFQF